MRRPLLARWWTLLALRRALILIRSGAALGAALVLLRITLILLLRVALVLLSALGLVRAAALMPLRMALTHLLVILILLVAVQHAHDLLAQLTAGTRIARTSFGMILRIAVDKRLNALLLIAR